MGQHAAHPLPDLCPLGISLWTILTCCTWHLVPRWSPKSRSSSSSSQDPPCSGHNRQGNGEGVLGASLSQHWGPCLLSLPLLLQSRGGN